MKVNLLLAVIGCAVVGVLAQNKTSATTIAFSVRKAATITNQFLLQASPFNVQFRVREKAMMKSVTYSKFCPSCFLCGTGHHNFIFPYLNQEVLTNDGAGWIPTTGEFIAPKSGVYFFTFSVMSAKTKEATVALMKNSDYQVTAFVNPGHNMATNSAVLSLKAGDSVHLVVQEGEIYENPLYESYTTLSGYQISSK
ncbi:complement C1q tumor necrosis factor-related protein 2-like isoform X1 [Macrobrachium nipponense]|uniref:complement C1q tumor necrosis factor-related protein 2-like isoform X1 n=1 Tax=Macrobrachium nipponense TaxID=159736 RepID=UPI0030C83635